VAPAGTLPAVGVRLRGQRLLVETGGAPGELAVTLELAAARRDAESVCAEHVIAAVETRAAGGGGPTP
jgi:hypothetical protein